VAALRKYALARKICELLEADLQAIGFELLDVRIFRGGGRLQVRVTIDSAGGVDLDGCARASRTAGILVEEAGLIQERYVIEVSSPGIRRPLRKPAHYAPYVGQMIEARCGSPEQPRSVRGRLLLVDAEGIRLACQGPPDESQAVTEITLAFADILEANLDRQFDARALIQADRRRRKDERRQQKQQRQEQRATRRKSRPKMA
jgi:ribosome maturation factor RimP